MISISGCNTGPALTNQDNSEADNCIIIGPLPDSRGWSDLLASECRQPGPPRLRDYRSISG